MKKLLIFLLTFCLTMSLAACGGNSKPKSDSDAANDNSPVVLDASGIMYRDSTLCIVVNTVNDSINEFLEYWWSQEAVTKSETEEIVSGHIDICNKQLQTLDTLNKNELFAEYESAVQTFIKSTKTFYDKVLAYVSDPNEDTSASINESLNQADAAFQTILSEREACLMSSGLSEKELAERLGTQADTTEPEPLPKSEPALGPDPAPATEPKPKPAPQTPSTTMGQQNALKSAKSYLNYSAFSYLDLIEQLEYEKYTTEEATWAADNCGADWYAEALKAAKKYIDYSAFSYTDLIEQLKYEKFTEDQAKYGADYCGADWNAEAVEAAKSYLEYSSFSRQDLIDQLLYEGFTQEQAVHGVTQNGY